MKEHVNERIGLAVFAVMLVISVAGVAPWAARADEKSEAKEAHRRGVELYQKGEYSEAAAAFRRAMELRPTWKLYFNVAQCEASAKRYGLALEAFEAYLIGGGDEVSEERTTGVTTEIRRLQALIGVLDVSAPGGSRVEVDGTVRARVPLNGPLRVAVGPHRVRILDGQSVLFDRKVRVASGMSTRVDVDRSGKEAPAGRAGASGTGADERAGGLLGPEDGEVDDANGSLKTAGWVTFGLGAAAAVAGAVVGGLTLGRLDDLDAKCPDKNACAHQDLADSAESMGVAADVLLWGGGALAATGAVLLIVDVVGDDDEKEEPAVSVRFRPLAVWGTGGIAFEGRF
jgi:hypothetical protein